MMFHKSLVSVVAAMALARKVAVSAIPVPNDGTSRCNTGSLQCCEITAGATDRNARLLSNLQGLGIPFDPNILVGMGCFPLVGTTQWCESFVLRVYVGG